MKEILTSRWNRQDVFLLLAKIRKNKFKCKLFLRKITPKKAKNSRMMLMF